MALDIYNVEGFNNGNPSFIPTFDVPNLDLSEVNSLGNSLVDLENKRIKNIEDNFDNLLDTKDEILGLDGGTAYGMDLIRQVRGDYGLNDDIFKFSMDQLKDPFHQRGVQSKLESAMNDPRMKEALMEGKAVKTAREDIRKLSRKDSGLATVAKSHLNNIVNDVNSKKTIFDFSVADYEKIDLKELIKADLDDIIKNNPNIEFKKRDKSPTGFVIFDKTRGIEMNLEDFVSQTMSKYEDDPRVANNWAALQDEKKPIGERSIEDVEAVEGLIKQAGNEVFNTFGGPRIVDTILREDKLKIDREVTNENIREEDNKQENRIELEKLKQKGKLANKGDTNSTFSAETNSILKTINSQGKILENPEDAVNINSRLKKGDQIKIEGGEAVIIDPKDDRDDLTIALRDIDIQDGINDLLATNPFISSNYNIGSEKYNYASEFLANPLYQDGFYSDYYVPQILDKGVEQLENSDLDTNSLNKNQLRYLVHHQGVAGSEHFLRTGEILPKTLEKAEGRNVKKELTNALAKFKKEGDFEEIKDKVESFDGNYLAVTTLPGSSALGRHQVLFDTHFSAIKSYIDNNGGIKLTQKSNEESGEENLDLTDYNKEVKEGLVQTKEIDGNIITNDPEIVKKFDSKNRFTAKNVNSRIENETDKFKHDRFDLGTGLFGVENAGSFIELTRDEFIEATGGTPAPKPEPEINNVRKGVLDSLNDIKNTGDNSQFTIEGEKFGFMLVEGGNYLVQDGNDEVMMTKDQLNLLIDQRFPKTKTTPKNLNDF